MSCIRIMSENFIDQDLLANSDVSSEQAAFPVENAYNLNRRTKVWRSNGFFEVVAGSNTIVFRDDTTTNKTATITPGYYNSTALFMAAVDTALEAAGAANYTVTQNANLRFVITSDLSGGATAFQIRWTHANSLAMAALMGFDTAVDDTGASSYTADLSRLHSSEWILWDLGIESKPDSFILIGPRNEPIKISPNAVLKLQGNHTNVWTSPVYETSLVYDDEVISALSLTGLGTMALRYWRVYFEDKSNPNGQIEVGAFFLGNFYSPTNGAVQFPWSTEAVDRTDTLFSEGGQTFSDIKPKTRQFSFEWKHLTKDEVQEMDLIFEKYGKGKPFFISMDSDAVFSTDYHRRLKYVKFQDEPSTTLDRPNRYSMRFNLLEQL